MPVRVFSPDNDTVAAGYYYATTLSAADADLVAGNIKNGVAIFGKTGTYMGLVYALPDTGQPGSYTGTYGEDHDYQPAASQPSYTVNADNTVTDNRTGLMWRRCSQGKNDDATCTGTSGSYTWEDAISQCENETADYSDWRLPNYKELLSIVSYGAMSPAINGTFPATTSTAYWTSTSYAGDGTTAWYVDFNMGGGDPSAKTTPQYVRCVRAGP